MTPGRFTLTFMILAVCVLLTAGCSGPFFGNTTVNYTTMVSPSALTMLPVQTQCLQSENTTPHIFINLPKGNHHLGDVFEITGTTNLGNDEGIEVSISGIVKSSPYPSSQQNLVGSYGQARVENSNCREKNWTYSVNTSGFNTAFYIVGVGARNWTVRNVSNFELIMGR